MMMACIIYSVYSEALKRSKAFYGNLCMAVCGTTRPLVDHKKASKQSMISAVLHAYLMPFFLYKRKKLHLVKFVSFPPSVGIQMSPQGACISNHTGSFFYFSPL